jgi:hypothetical protein
MRLDLGLVRTRHRQAAQFGDFALEGFDITPSLGSFHGGP